VFTFWNTTFHLFEIRVNYQNRAPDLALYGPLLDVAVGEMTFYCAVVCTKS